MRTQYRLAIVGTVCALALSGCSAAPRQRPVKMGPVDAGAGSVEDARRQLQGLWDLVSLTAFQPGEQATQVKATAVLSYDEYGNLQMKGRVAEESRQFPASAPLLDYTGKAVIDVTRQQLQLMSVSGNLPSGQVPPELSFKSIRKYAIEGDRLTVSTIDAQGNITATAVWKRRAQ